MYKSFFSVVLFLFVLHVGLPTASAAEVLNVYPSDDAFAQLYDQDAISDWSDARNYQGEIFNEPLSEGLASDAGQLFVRSDKGVGTYRIYRTSKVFNLNELPDGAKIKAAKLHLYKTAGNNQGDISVVVTAHEREDVALMQKQDWVIDTFGDKEFSRNQLQDGLYTEFDFNDDGLAFLNERVDNQITLGLLTNFDFDDVEPQGNILAAGWYSIEKTGTDFDPYLEVEYSLAEEEKYPLYTQIESPYPSIEETKEWADDKFARSDDESAINKCETIAQCGCAITSLVMMARSEGLKFGVDGKDINPGTLNTWLIENNGYDKQGNVFWSRAIDYFGQMEEDKIVTPFNLIDHKVIKINESVEDGNYVLGFSASNGHYIYLTGLSGSGFSVRDPHWYNTETTNDSLDLKNFVQDYNDKINRGVAYSFASSSIQKGIIEVTLNSPAELLLVDDLGNETGYKEDGVLVENIEKSSYVQDEFIADQEVDIDANHHVTKRLLKTDAVGKYELQVIGTGAGEYTITLSVKTNSGDNVFNEIVGETELGQIDEFLIDMEDGSVEEIEDSEDDLILDRDRFIALVVAATEGKHRVIERFFVRSANRIFDSIEKDKNKLAQLQLKVFGKLLRAKKISDEDLDEAVKDLTAALKVK